MAYEFKKLSEVESLSEAPEGANLLAEIDGEVKRIPSDGLKSGGSATPVVFKVSNSKILHYETGEAASAEEVVDLYMAGMAYIDSGRDIANRIVGFNLSSGGYCPVVLNSNNTLLSQQYACIIEDEFKTAMSKYMP